MTGKQGPKTKSGKAKSAKNSTSHGLRSEALTSSKQVQDQKIFLDELIAFYKPVGPLETLQLERIASCRAKLNAIRELEQSKLLLLYSEHKSNIKKYIAGFTYLDPLVRGMIYELITFEKLILPCDLDTDNLEKIVDEIEAFSGVISSDSDFEEYVPCLTSYLLSINESEVNLNEKLLAVSKKLDFIIRNGDLYCEYLKKLIPDRFVDKKKSRPSNSWSLIACLMSIKSRHEFEEVKNLKSISKSVNLNFLI